MEKKILSFIEVNDLIDNASEYAEKLILALTEMNQCVVDRSAFSDCQKTALIKSVRRFKLAMATLLD